jgi:hypothetical protein
VKRQWGRFFSALRPYPPSILPPLLHTNMSLVYYRRYTV